MNDRSRPKAAPEVQAEDTTDRVLPAPDTGPAGAPVEVARERYEAAHAVYVEALAETVRLGAVMQEAAEDLRRTITLARPLRDVLDQQLRDYIWRRPPTARRLARETYRPVADVQAELDGMVAEGNVRTVGTGYEAVAS